MTKPVGQPMTSYFVAGNAGKRCKETGPPALFEFSNDVMTAAAVLPPSAPQTQSTTLDETVVSKMKLRGCCMILIRELAE